MKLIINIIKFFRVLYFIDNIKMDGNDIIVKTNKNLIIDVNNYSINAKKIGCLETNILLVNTTEAIKEEDYNTEEE